MYAFIWRALRQQITSATLLAEAENKGSVYIQLGQAN